VSSADQPVDPHDAEMWMRLQQILNDGQVSALALESRWLSAPDFAQEAVRNTVQLMDQLADGLAEALVPPEARVQDGSARAVARSLVGLCRTFVQHWSSHPTVTVGRLREFNQDLELVIDLLDSCRDGQSPP
jgi:hypothetical protein